MNTIATQGRSPLTFFALLLALSIPFWLLGAATGIQLLPGLPVSSLIWIGPVTAAAILVYRKNGSEGVRALLERSFDYGRISAKVWYAPIVLLMPAVTVLSYVLLRWMGSSLPAPHFQIVRTLASFLALFFAAECEELGWSGYAIDPMQDRFGAFAAAVLLGLVWAVWHYVPLLQAHRMPVWIAWWSLFTVASRVVIVWLYNNTGRSVFAAALYHAITNLCWLSFPEYATRWDPRITGLLVASVAAIVTIIWGPRRLARSGNVQFPRADPSAGTL